MNKIELQKNIDNLINKWKGKKPKDNSLDYWKYKCDRCLYIRYKNQLDNFENLGEELNQVEELDCEQAEKILMS
jgi:hypothetical protein